MTEPAFTPEAVKRIRLAMGLTQVEFAVRLCVSSGSVSAWEQGRAKPRSLASLAALHEAAQEVGNG